MLSRQGTKAPRDTTSNMTGFRHKVSPVPQINSSTRAAMVGLGLESSARMALRSLMPSSSPTWASSAPRSYRRDTTVRLTLLQGPGQTAVGRRGACVPRDQRPRRQGRDRGARAGAGATGPGGTGQATQDMSQISSSTRVAMVGFCLGSSSRTALRSLMPSSSPTWSSSAPRS